jgi:hypothetical protein
MDKKLYQTVFNVYKDKFTVQAIGNVDDIMTDIGLQLIDAGADIAEIQCGFAFSTVDALALSRDNLGDALHMLDDMFEMMREHMIERFSPKGAHHG